MLTENHSMCDRRGSNRELVSVKRAVPDLFGPDPTRVPRTVYLCDQLFAIEGPCTGVSHHRLEPPYHVRFRRNRAPIARNEHGDHAAVRLKHRNPKRFSAVRIEPISRLLVDNVSADESPGSDQIQILLSAHCNVGPSRYRITVVVGS